MLALEQRVSVANSRGCSPDHRRRAFLAVTVVAEESQWQTGRDLALTESDAPTRRRSALAAEAAGKALIMLDARPAPPAACP